MNKNNSDAWSRLLNHPVPAGRSVRVIVTALCFGVWACSDIRDGYSWPDAFAMATVMTCLLWAAAAVSRELWASRSSEPVRTQWWRDMEEALPSPACARAYLPFRQADEERGERDLKPQRNCGG